MSIFDVAASAIHEAFAVEIDVRADGLQIDGISAVKSEGEVEFNRGSSMRTTSFELRYHDVADRPEKGWQIRERLNGREWRVLQSARDDEVGAWRCTVEAARA